MFKNLKSEFKKITWASPKSTFKNFGIVLVGLIAAAIVIGVVDLGLQSLFNFLASHIG
jgi:preprotein translocase SecE subunit